jgi:hypothetical protein
VEVNLNYKALQGYALTPYDVVNAITAQNLTLPSGTEKIGRCEYLVGLNSSPDTIGKLNANPIKSLPNGTSGAYVQVTLKIPGHKGGLTVPAGTLLFSSGKPVVGVVRPNPELRSLGLINIGEVCDQGRISTLVIISCASRDLPRFLRLE